MSEPGITNPPRRHPTAGYRIFEGQATIVLPDGSYIKVLNEVGSRVWDLLDGERTEAEIVDVICEEFETPRDRAEQDVREFIAALAEHRMLE